MISWERKKLRHWNFFSWSCTKYETFLWKNHAENHEQKLVSDLFLIVVDNQKQPLYVRNSFENKIFWKDILKGDYQKALKKVTLFCSLIAVPFNDQDYETRRGALN